MPLNNLVPGTTYHYRLAATNSGGANYGADATFTTATLGAEGPGVLNEPTADVTYNAATLNAAVDPDGLATNVYFLYGVTGSYGSATATQAIGSGTNDVAVQAQLTNLLPNTTYHYLIAATNGSGTTTSGDQTFQTGAVGISGFSPAQAAAGATLTLSGVGFTGATGVLFNQLGTVTDGSFVVVSDTEMTVTVPNCGVRGGGYYITVLTGAGVTVTMDPATLILENGNFSGSGGGAEIYVDGGGSATNNGSGGDTYYVKNGGSVYSTGGGGDNVAYAEPGATVTGVTVVPEANVSQSPVPVLFQFLAPARAVTGLASNVAINNAMTSGTVNAEGTPTTACIQYGPDSGASSNTGGATALGSATSLSSAGSVYVNQTPSQSIGSGTTDMPLAVNLTGLTSNTLYDFRVAVTNAAGTTYGTEEQFTTLPGPHDIWNENEFTQAELGNSAISGDTAEPAGDGIPNLMKYALGLSPMTGATSGLPYSSTAAINGTNCLTFTYTKMDAATDITYHPEWSTDLSNWTNAGLTEVVLSDNGTSQQVQDSIPMSNSYPIFFHLRVTMP